jgi:hypothetical protein
MKHIAAELKLGKKPRFQDIYRGSNLTSSGHVLLSRASDPDQSYSAYIWSLDFWLPAEVQS